MDGCEVGCGEAVVSRGDAPEVLQPTEHSFDGVPAAVERGAEAALPASVRLGWDVRYRAARFDRTAEAIRIEGAISDHQGALGNSLDQRLAAAEVGCVATGEAERDRLGLSEFLCLGPYDAAEGAIVCRAAKPLAIPDEILDRLLSCSDSSADLAEGAS